MSLRRLFSHNFHLQPQFKLNKPIIFTKSIQALAIITENSSTTTKLNLTHDVEWTPGSISYSKLLSQCCKTQSLNPGLQIHTHLIKLGLNHDPKCRNHLINLYSKCRVFVGARQLLDESPEPDLVSWSALISGYVLNGFGEEAISGFREMHALGIRCNEFTFPSVLKACSMKKDIVGGKQIHGVVVVTGFESDVFVANTLVVVYAKCGEFLDSRRLFDQIPERNIVSWNALFSCYTQGDFFEKAIELFRDMVGSGLRPDEFSLSTIINACTGLRDINEGRKIHGYLMKHGYSSDPFSCNALVDMYSKVGDFEDAKTVFDQIKNPDIVSWNAVIAGCVLHEYNDTALELSLNMRRSGTKLNMFTFSSILKACSGLGLQDLGQQFHAVLIKSNIELDPFLCCGLIDIYSKCGQMEDATRVYNMMPEKELIAFNALLCGHSHNDNDIEALALFVEEYGDGIGFNETTLLAILNAAASLQVVNVTEQIHGLSLRTGFQSDPFVINSLIDSYAKGGSVEKARKVFDESPIADLATFTSLISAYAYSGQGEEAIKLYLKMQDLELKPDSFICSSLLNTSASLSAYEQGKQIHVHTLKFGLLSDTFTANSLVNMYARCGSIDDATRAFSEVPEKGIVSWSAMIGGFAQHGHGKEALSLFDDMLKDGIAPNNVTLVSVLCACNHAGLVTQAKQYFESMEDVFGIKPTQEHYACMIDILGRAGKLHEAMDLVNKMPFEANASVWGALLGAAKTHKNVDLGQIAAQKLMLLDPEKSGTHVLLANIYASAGLWENVADIRRLMKDSKVKKEPGMSWLEVKDRVYTFIVGDRSHSRTKQIYEKLDELMELVGKEGYVPVLEIDLHNVKTSEKELLLSYHSEKLAVAFALIATPTRAPIRVKKNLRVCVDCHTFLKFVSKVVAREIIVRDINRFHHFRDGLCSCGDYW
ncbi:putative tetratricopeptide-like helical domain superfamily, DYW domain-containing protein [Helianthus annuus]|uniref:Putative tetratricopeptide repeat (TPR)-like superfamily protein n=1 Tax=Helianthus annuus TaxID=4232 RepID=A0A251S9J6_HELAN|nr:pentatricopeptide repeat-containing protein At5g04780, mitochondrial [Helianthus annuus]KAF5764951.1 putative tetratricopeptide-like helical domain superfamily, DYW domain-containing protein [Helianthus annuus]KAJ0451560.1 putative tetratricopeptide-like helical domain superfamily, DYW domain-containing protein [Helianthus annuus]KAJ0456108.1 putative tetratricopeptide-like helical domain superfamily, DYW domain-containing protein [Helianthus annuus]KAJ0473435.1 putative tetratricopeptide-li